jgi:hypothetical protein
MVDNDAVCGRALAMPLKKNIDRPHVDATIWRLFPVERHGEAFEVLAMIDANRLGEEMVWLKLAALYLCNGSMQRLAELVRLANDDHEQLVAMADEQLDELWDARFHWQAKAPKPEELGQGLETGAKPVSLDWLEGDPDDRWHGAYTFYDEPIPADEVLGQWRSAAGRFSDVAGYAAFGDVFLRDPESGEYAILSPYMGVIQPTGMRQEEDFREHMEEPENLQRYGRPADFQKLWRMLGPLREHQVYQPLNDALKLSVWSNLENYVRDEVWTLLDFFPPAETST